MRPFQKKILSLQVARDTIGRAWLGGLATGEGRKQIIKIRKPNLRLLLRDEDAVQRTPPRAHSPGADYATDLGCTKLERWGPSVFSVPVYNLLKHLLSRFQMWISFYHIISGMPGAKSWVLKLRTYALSTLLYEHAKSVHFNSLWNKFVNKSNFNCQHPTPHTLVTFFLADEMKWHTSMELLAHACVPNLDIGHFLSSICFLH